jgi:hypothetical protein
MTSAPTSRTRPNCVRPSASREKSSAAITTSSVLPTAWPRIVPAGCTKLSTAISPSAIPGPETEAPEDQGGHADTHRGPQRRDAPVQIGKLQLCLGSKPVHRADPGNSAQIAQVAIHLVSGSQ